MKICSPIQECWRGTGRAHPQMPASDFLLIALAMGDAWHPGAGDEAGKPPFRSPQPPQPISSVRALISIPSAAGHVSLDITNVYAEIDLEMKAKASPM